MKELAIYDTDPTRENLEKVKNLLRSKGFIPRFAVVNNQTNLQKIGDYVCSGGGSLILVPDDFIYPE